MITHMQGDKDDMQLSKCDKCQILQSNSVTNFENVSKKIDICKE